MAYEVSTLYGANVYIDGVNHAGQIDELTCPNPKPKNIDHHPMSGVGAIKLPNGLEPMELKLKFNSITPFLMAKSADFYNAMDLMIRCNSDQWSGDSRTGSQPVTMFVRGRSNGVPPIAVKGQTNTDIDIDINVSYYKLEINGQVIFELDFYAQIYIVDGKDLLADYRANLGI